MDRQSRWMDEWMDRQISVDRLGRQVDGWIDIDRQGDIDMQAYVHM